MTIFSSTHHTIDAVGNSAVPRLNLLQRVFAAFTVRRERRALLALDDRMLADVGLSHADAYREAKRPFLDVPAYGPRHRI